MPPVVAVSIAFVGLAGLLAGLVALLAVFAGAPAAEGFWPGALLIHSRAFIAGMLTSAPFYAILRWWGRRVGRDGVAAMAAAALVGLVTGAAGAAAAMASGVAAPGLPLVGAAALAVAAVGALASRALLRVEAFLAGP